jgi:endonuclease III related protein
VKKKLAAIYNALYRHFGPQRWWPGRTPFEVMVGAVLTQSTSWANVEKAIANLRKEKLLSPAALHRTPRARLARLIRPAGYYTVKARRLAAFTGFFLSEFGGSAKVMAAADGMLLRPRLLSVHGIGEETADSILLYALNKPFFVVDAYTKRIFSRHGLCEPGISYAGLQSVFAQALKPEPAFFNEFHALIVAVGKNYCRKQAPRCRYCPLQRFGP